MSKRMEMMYLTFPLFRVKELTEQTGSQQLENTALHTTNKALQQQVQDMTTLLATEQEKTLTLLKDKKEVIKQKHESLKVGTDFDLTLRNFL